MQLSPNHINHLYNRACFGLPFDKFLSLKGQTLGSSVTTLFRDSFDRKNLSTFENEAPQRVIAQKVRSGQMSRQDARRALKAQMESSRERIKDLNREWVLQMHEAQYAGLEKLVYFWHDHFGLRVGNAYYTQSHNNTLRKHALGPLKELLVAVAQDPAMLVFLNNQQNVKAKPNENFARELLELFTLGQGNYSEKDIKEAARAFTGWRTDRRTGDFTFDRRNHDTGRKSFMGKKGNFDGYDIISIVLENKQTAKFLAAKFYAFYVSDIPNSKHIDEMAEHYYQSRYRTESLLKFLFSQPWFYEASQIQAKIKSPIELLNGLQAQLGLSFKNSAGWLILQRNFSQVMLYPPSVAGWPKSKEWIDSSSLVNRMKLPTMLMRMEGYQQEQSPEFDANDPLQKVNSREALASAELGLWAFHLPEGTATEQVHKVEEYLLGKKLAPNLHNKILNSFQKKTSAQRKQWLFTTITSLPEYQMV